HGGEFLPIGHQRAALLEAFAVEPEDAVVRAPAERKSIFLGFVVAPDADGVEPDPGRFAVSGKLHADAAPLAIDRAIELRLVAGRQGLFDVTAVAAGVEVSGPVAERQPESERVVEDFILR